MKNSWIIPVATLALGAAGGYLSGKGSSATSGTTAAENEVRTRSSGRMESSGGDATKKGTRPTSTADISRMPGNSSRLQAMMEFYGGLSPQQFADEAAKLEALPMNERLVASFLLFGRWAETDPTAAMAFSNTMGMAGGFVRPTILQSWASVDPANAAKYYAEHTREFAMMDMMGGGRGGPMGGQGASSIIATEWARQDPAAAMAWAASLTTGKGQAMNAVVSELAKTDPRKAAEMISQFDEASKADAYRAVASQYGAKDFNEAQAWIRTLPADDQAAALAAAIGGLSNSDPEKAAQQVSAMADGDAKDRLVGNIARDLARKDPQAAADFVTAQTSQRAQQDSMREFMPTWTNQNPVAALAFANNLPQGDVRDSAIGAYVWSNNTSAPADLVKTAETITDEGDRNRAIGVAAMRWMREDETAAKEYVQSSTVLSDEAKQRITEGRGMWGGGGGGGRNRGGGGGGGN